MRLRILHLPGIFERATHPRDVYRVKQQLRQKARNQERSVAGGQSQLIVDERIPGGQAAMRMSA